MCPTYGPAGYILLSLSLSLSVSSGSGRQVKSILREKIAVELE